MQRKIPLFRYRAGILMILLIAVSANCFSQDLYLYVGKTGKLSTPDPPGYGKIDKAGWSTDNPYLEIFDSSEYNTLVRINHYFEGTAKVECLYSYTLIIESYDKEYYHPGHATKTFRIKCKPNYATISNEDVELNIGETYQLTYQLDQDSDIDGEWSSSNESVATVDSKGRVTAISPGKARIGLDPIVGPVVYCDVEVIQIDPTSVSIPSSLTVYAGESSTLSASLEPYNATTTLTWYSKDKNVATVSSGKVTGVDEGSTIVYAQTANGLTSNDCKVNVYYRKPTAIGLDDTSLTLPVGGNHSLKYNLTPSHAKASVMWTSTNPTVISVSADGKLSALKVGKASITATTDNGCTATCAVQVLPLPIQLSLPQTLTLGANDTYKLDIQSYPSECYLALEWTSSDESVAAVSDNGEVEGVGTGHAMVTATASNGVSISCRVEVTEPAYFLNLWLYDGGCFTYPLSLHPTISASKEVTIIKTPTESVEFQTSDVHKYTLSKTDPIAGEYNEITSVESVLQENSPYLRIEQNSIVLSQCAANMPVDVYSISGQLTGTYKTDANGYLAIPTNSLFKGVYIIKSRSITCKIVKK